ncbi:DEAD/DEAH box helicase [Corynebacterium epidermidicanis]|uniref:DNA/RNA helicase, superfamily II, SNF2 family n=1 Tax=Corynebacterium epidermidicanis TaxID=1050174 RepID=A0A0G3GQM0_9CORY|nr:DEAD/DEAH box helicase [Corynebacterium epidermidicanis]AKK02855.1 DNA/RNA helicase, superfamily II, SNF2 family [Corynebacterium epidermidicanis]
MTSHLLHGFWTKESGLHLWIEQVEGHRIVLPESVPDDAFSAVTLMTIRSRRFTHLHKTVLQTPKGRQVQLEIPTAACTPEQAVEILSNLQVVNGPEIAPDLRWLMHVAAGLSNFVRAGRVVLRVNWEDSQWWPQWQLASGLGERGWLAEMTAAAPGFIIANGGSGVAENMADELPHWIANQLLASRAAAPRSAPWTEFVAALLHSQPLRRGGVRLVSKLNAWKETITQGDISLVIIVEEPDKEDTSTDPADQPWIVRVQLRFGTDSPQPVRLLDLDAVTRKQVKSMHDRLVATYPLFGDELAQRRAREEATARQGLGFDPVSGDLDIVLDMTQMVEFITNGVTILRKAGFLVLLPKSWNTLTPKLALDTRNTSDPAVAATKTTIGLEQLVEYNWRMSLGDIELTDSEMAELVSAKSGLINLRGQWVMADTDALRKVANYVEELARSSRKQLKQRMETAAMEAELARANGDPRAAEFERIAEELRQQYNNMHAEFGKVSLAELRELALRMAEDTPIEFTGSKWHESILGGGLLPAPERVDIPPTVHAELREYQRRGVDWLYWMSQNNLGAVLADDMGLGKTLQLLALLAVERAETEEAVGPTLVVCPTSVVGNWVNEATRFVPDLTVVSHHGSNRLADQAFVEAASAADLVITSYGVVSRDHKLLAEVGWERVVLDEAQAIKNSATRASKSVRALPSRHRVALTGTPVENRLSEMRSILDFCNPGVLGSASFFRNHFAKAIERENSEEMRQRLRLLTAPFILRRLKTDPSIIDDLPDKQEEILTVQMTTEQAALYKAYTDDIAERLAQVDGIAKKGLVLSMITRIKQICNHPAHFLGDGSPITDRGRHRSGKVEMLMELVDAAVQREEKMLIFTQYRAFGDILVPYLSEWLGRDIPFLHGGVSKVGRDRIVAEFQTEAGPPAMVLSLKAGGTGLNLTSANVVVHLDRWWNPAVENQATDRAYRIGQEKNVRVYKMITQGTMEEKVQLILDGKLELANTIVGEGEGWITELSAADLALLLSYREEED